MVIEEEKLLEILNEADKTDITDDVSLTFENIIIDSLLKNESIVINKSELGFYTVTLEDNTDYINFINCISDIDVIDSKHSVYGLAKEYLLELEAKYNKSKDIHKYNEVAEYLESATKADIIQYYVDNVLNKSDGLFYYIINLLDACYVNDWLIITREIQYCYDRSTLGIDKLPFYLIDNTDSVGRYTGKYLIINDRR